jgi:hypothetical protein
MTRIRTDDRSPGASYGDAMATTTIASPSLRTAAGVCIAGGLLTTVASIATGVVTDRTSVSDDLFRYPFTSGAFVVFTLCGAVLHLTILVGILGLIRSGVAGDGRAARIGGPLAAGGTALLFLAELLSLLVIDTSESAGSAGAVGAVFGLATILATVGMLALGVATLREGRWQDWRRFTPLACGLVVLLLVPIQLTSALWAGVGAYGLCFALLGVALLREASPRVPVGVPAGIA